MSACDYLYIPSYMQLSVHAVMYTEGKCKSKYEGITRDLGTSEAESPTDAFMRHIQ